MPDRDYNTRRARCRAAELLAAGQSDENKAIAKLVNGLYDRRSRIVHGAALTEKDRRWLYDNSREIETRVRQILVTAVNRLPPGNDERKSALAELYDPTGEERVEAAVRKFEEIPNQALKQQAAAKIAELASER